MNAIVATLKFPQSLIPAEVREFLAEFYAATPLAMFIAALRNDA